MGFRTALLAIHLSGVHSLPNKMDELLFLSRTNRDFAHSAAHCLTETCDSIPDCGLYLPGFQLLRVDRITELSGKSEGGGICFYIHEGWCTVVTVLHEYLDMNLEFLVLNCKSFYSPREFSCFILVGVYIPPKAKVGKAERRLARLITCLEQEHMGFLVIILGGFNRAN